MADGEDRQLSLSDKCGRPHAAPGSFATDEEEKSARPRRSLSQGATSERLHSVA
jgi:hypothetical protein